MNERDFECGLRLVRDIFNQRLIRTVLYTPYLVTTVRLNLNISEKMTRNLGKALSFLPLLKVFQAYGYYSYYFLTPFLLFSTVKYIGTNYVQRVYLSLWRVRSFIFSRLPFYKECVYFLRKAVEKEHISFRVKDLENAKKDEAKCDWWYGDCMKGNIFG